MNKDKYYNIKIMNKGYGKTYYEMQKLITNLQHQISLMKEDIRESKEINGELQQENETLHENNQNMQEEMTRVWEENERLKELNENASKVCMAEHKYGVDKAEEAKDYKSRCEKAIEYIKEHYPTSTINDQDDKYNLLNILQNGSDDK